MDDASRYWQLVRLDSAGHCWVQPLPEVQAWFKQVCSDLLEVDPLPHAEIQARLWTAWQAGDSPAHLAERALRCFITHPIRQVGIQLEQQFGRHYGFHCKDLFPPSDELMQARGALVTEVCAENTPLHQIQFCKLTLLSVTVPSNPLGIYCHV